MLLLQVRAKIVASPWVAEVFEIGGPFLLLLNKSSSSWPN